MLLEKEKKYQIMYLIATMPTQPDLEHRHRQAGYWIGYEKLVILTDFFSPLPANFCNKKIKVVQDVLFSRYLLPKKSASF